LAKKESTFFRVSINEREKEGFFEISSTFERVSAKNAKRMEQ